MSAPTIEDMRQTIAAIEHYGSISGAARAMGLARQTVQSRYKIALTAARQGKLGTDAVIPGFEISRVSEGPRGKTIEQRPERGDVFEMPSTHGLGKMTVAVGPDGRVERQWLRATPGAIDYDAFADRLYEKYSAIDFKLPEIPEPKESADANLNFVGLGDLHYGLRISGREVGGEDWGIEKADRLYRRAFGDLMGETTPAKQCVLMVGGDVTHQNDGTNRTPNSGHILDVDGTFTDAVEAAQEFILEAALMAAQVHQEVEVAFIKGNHDEESITAVGSFLRGAFRGHNRITVTPPRKRTWVRQHGLTMLACAHGDKMKPALLPGFMAAEHPDMWGATRFRYGHTFHVHHKTKQVDEMHGVCLVTHQCPAPRDSWHYYMAFLSGRSFEATTYHMQKGYRGTMMEPVMPEYIQQRGAA